MASARASGCSSVPGTPLELSRKSIGIDTESHRDDQDAASQGPTDFLVRPAALMEVVGKKCGQGVHRSQAHFDFVQPLTTGFNVLMGDKPIDTSEPQGLFECRGP